PTPLGRGARNVPGTIRPSPARRAGNRFEQTTRTPPGKTGGQVGPPWRRGSVRRRSFWRRPTAVQKRSQQLQPQDATSLFDERTLARHAGVLKAREPVATGPLASLDQSGQLCS